MAFFGESGTGTAFFSLSCSVSPATAAAGGGEEAAEVGEGSASEWSMRARSSVEMRGTSPCGEEAAAVAGGVCVSGSCCAASSVLLALGERDEARPTCGERGDSEGSTAARSSEAPSICCARDLRRDAACDGRVGDPTAGT